MQEATSVVANRWWVPKGTNIELGDGFLEADREALELREELTYLHCLDSVPCIVLLGPPGIGKSTEFEQAIAIARARNHDARLVSLRGISSAEALIDAVFSVDQPENADRVRFVFLDALDEAVATVPVMQQWLLNAAVKARQLARDGDRVVLLRVSSRAADWSEQFEDQLRQALGKDAIQVFELPPLTRQQAATFVEAKAVPTSDFFAQLQRCDAAAFASRPVTLKMLIDSFVLEGSLSDNKVTIYRRGLLALLEESNRARIAAGLVGQLSPEQRFVIAARIAAASVLSTHTTIWDGLYSDPSPENAVRVAELAGDIEEGFGYRISVNPAHIRETLRSSVFHQISQSTFEWAHNTFSEFLCAYYIAAHVTNPDTVLAIIRFGVPGNDRVVPQLKEVAAWLTALAPGIGERLIKSEPELLLSSDVALASNADRRDLVGRLLTKLDSLEIYDKSEWRSHYRRLDHPDLVRQLTPIIRDKLKSVMVRRAAIDIAEACFKTDLESDLRAVAFDQTDDPRVRAQAVHALTQIVPVERRKELVPLLLRREPDPDDEIKGYLLLGLWPANLSPRELFGALTRPKNTSLIGSYAIFLYEFRIEQLDRDGALAALKWLMDQPSSERLEHHFAELIPNILTQAWRNVDDQEVRRRLAALVLSNPMGNPWRHEAKLQSFELEYHASQPSQRRELLRAIFASAPKDWTHARFLTFAPWAVVTISDLPWLAAELTEKDGSWPEDWLIDIIINLISWDSRSQIEFLWDVPHPGLGRALDSVSFVPLDSDFAKWQRELRESKKRRVEKPTRASRDVTVQRLLKKSERGDHNAFWLLNLALLEDDARRTDEFTGVLAPSPGWTALDEDGRRRVLAEGVRYLKTYPISADYLGANVHHRPAAAGYRALRLLFDQDRTSYVALPSEVWAKWSLPIVAFVSNDSAAEREIQKQILKDCFSHCPEEVLSAISVYLQKTQGFTQVISLQRGWAPTPILDAIWNALSASDVSADEYERAFEELVESRYQPAINRADDSLHRLLDPNVTSGLEQEINKAAAIISAQPQRTLDALSQIIPRENVGQALLIRVVQAWRRLRVVNIGLTEAQQAQLYVWIETLLDRPPERKGAHFVTPIDEVFDFQRAVLGNLVGLGTSASVAAVASIVERLPQIDWLRWSLGEARENQRRTEWRPSSPRSVLEMIVGRTQEVTKISDKETLAQQRVDAAAQSDRLSAINLHDPVPQEVPLVAPGVRTASTIDRKLAFLVVNDEWNSGHGGISTFNRYLCNALAQYGHEVYCFIPSISEREISAAKQLHVSILVSGDNPGLSTPELLARGPAEPKRLKPDIVIGHDQVSGAQALALARELFCCPYIHFVHSNPEEMELFRETEESRETGIVDYVKADRKASAQKEICFRADVVLTVGPKLEEHIRTALIDRKEGHRIVQVIPGLNPELLRFQRPIDGTFALQCLLSGRLDELRIKGTDLFVRIAGQFQRRSLGPTLGGTTFIMRGFAENAMNENVAHLCERYGVKLNNILARRFITDELELQQELKTASIFLLPSKVEAFGLTGLDAIAAGIPLIASSSSGLGKVIANAAPDLPGNLKQIALDCVLDVSDDDDVVEQWTNAVQAKLSDCRKAFSDANDLRNALKETFDWNRVAENVTKAALLAMER